jgi:hypothetical protein
MDETSFGSQIKKGEHERCCGTMQTSINQFQSLFDGTLGHWKEEHYDITLHPDAIQTISCTSISYI